MQIQVTQKMSQNNETQQQTRIERVVVWEGEWAPVRRYFHHVLVLKDKIIKTSMDTVDSTAKALCETKTSLVKTTECKFFSLVMTRKLV